MLALAVALFLAWVGFSVLWLVLVDPHDCVALFIGLQILIPSLCVVPYLSLITGRPFAAVVFAAVLVGVPKESPALSFVLSMVGQDLSTIRASPGPRRT
jgi:hypothetical protein